MGIVVWRFDRGDETLRLAFANSAAERLVHQTFASRVGESMLELFPHTSRERMALYANVALTQKPWKDVIQGRAHVSTEAFAMDVFPLEGDHVVICFENLTEQRMMQAEVQRLNLHLDAIFERLPLTLFVVDAHDLRVQRINRAGEELLGVPRSALIGKTAAELFAPQAVAEFTAAAGEAIASGAMTNTPEQHIDTPRGPRIVRAQVVPIRDVEGATKSLVGITVDVSEEREQEAALRAAKESAEEATGELESFSHSVAHDLRTPLRAIHGFSEALGADYADKLDENAHDYLSRIRRAAARMGELIDDLLRLGRITRAEIHREPVDLSAIVRTIAARLRDANPRREARFVVAPDLVTVGDSRLLKILLENLLENAFRFTEHGLATIAFGRETNRGQPAYFVRDNGVGFDMAHASRLFAAFERLHTPSVNEGRGIGLAIAQRVARRHGGSIWAESAVGQGATFYFTLGAERPTA